MGLGLDKNEMRSGEVSASGGLLSGGKMIGANVPGKNAEICEKIAQTGNLHGAMDDMLKKADNLFDKANPLTRN